MKATEGYAIFVAQVSFFLFFIFSTRQVGEDFHLQYRVFGFVVFNLCKSCVRFLDLEHNPTLLATRVNSEPGNEGRSFSRHRVNLDFLFFLYSVAQLRLVQFWGGWAFESCFVICKLFVTSTAYI